MGTGVMSTDDGSKEIFINAFKADAGVYETEDFEKKIHL